MTDIPEQNTMIYAGGGADVAPNVRNWATEIDPNTIRQAAVTGRLPILAGPVALMPDAHLGYGAAVGSVIATEGAIIPSAVGVDVGCGMAALRTDLTDNDLPDDLRHLLGQIQRNVPAGVGRGHDERDLFKGTYNWFERYGIPEKFDADQRKKAMNQFGTLGSGNHFVEISIDDHGQVWIVLHSGSRGIGNQIANAHIKDASKHFAERVHGVNLEDKDLAWFVEGTPEFNDYTDDLQWLQEYAYGNRQAMLLAVERDLFKIVGHGQVVQTINCHHNYAARETHDGRGVWVTRKGAIRAFEGDLGIIPGSMGTDTFIVEGLGNETSWCSCSHGAGRRMSRTQAKKNLTIESLKTAMDERTWLHKDAYHLLDEHPEAYKSIEAVMADQMDLVSVIRRLTSVLNYKG